MEVKFKANLTKNGISYKKGQSYELSLEEAQLLVNKGLVFSDNLIRKYANKKTEFNKILVTGGIGDWLAIQSFLPKMNLKKIYFATRMFDILVPLINLTYPQIEIISLFNDWNNKKCFYQKLEFKDVPDDWEEVKDLSILRFFPEIDQGIWEYCGFPFLEILINTELPKKFVVIVPDSGNKFDNRNFTEEEWVNVIDFLHKNKIYGVILRKNNVVLKKNKRIIDLSNLTSLLESIEIMRKAIGYIGIDSCLSVIAAKLPYEIMKIKTINQHLIKWQHVYYAPKTEFNFLSDKISF